MTLLNIAMDEAQVVLRALKSVLHPGEEVRIVETGALRRRMPLVEELEFLIEVPPGGSEEELKTRFEQKLKEVETLIPINLKVTRHEFFTGTWIRTTGSPMHLQALALKSPIRAKDEAAFYKHLGLPWIPPELRETGKELELAKEGKLDGIIRHEDLKGILHIHTEWSDGRSTMKELIAGAQALGMTYMGFTDHSQSADYARGLTVDRLKFQGEKIAELRKEHPETTLFWGIECDIRSDGSLDYPDEVLALLDFVIVSIHSDLEMPREQMTQRILKALSNPYTRIFAHPTGRLLPQRLSYAVDMPEVISEATRLNVAIELNANPQRLDVDWSWGELLREKGTMVSIDPDAHWVFGLSDVQYGVMMARKAMLPKNQILNTQNAKELATWFKRQ